MVERGKCTNLSFAWSVIFGPNYAFQRRDDVFEERNFQFDDLRSSL